MKIVVLKEECGKAPKTLYSHFQQHLKLV